jgi:hypothetical protein
MEEKKKVLSYSFMLTNKYKGNGKWGNKLSMELKLQYNKKEI